MNTFRKKRRAKPGPSKNELKVMRGRQEASGGASLGQMLPTVRSLTVSLQFLTPQGHLLDESSETLKKDDEVEFVVDCPGRCGAGKFDFSQMIERAATERQPTLEVTVACSQPIYAGATETCGTSLRCRLGLEFAA